MLACKTMLSRVAQTSVALAEALCRARNVTGV
jgi:hypothetical protein